LTLGNPTHENTEIERVRGSDRFNVRKLEGDPPKEALTLLSVATASLTVTLEIKAAKNSIVKMLLIML
jgi:hypothetical protein